MLIEEEFICAHCGRANSISVDPGGGRRQQYVEDCQTCCRPHVLTIEIDASGETARVDAEAES